MDGVDDAHAWTVEEADECSSEVVALCADVEGAESVGGATLVVVAVREVVVVDVVVGVAGVEVDAEEAACA